MWAAVVAVRKHQPTQIVIAVPVAAPETCHELEAEVDKIVFVSTPSPFQSVGLWYENFPQITDEEVRDLLAEAAKNDEPISIGM
jgi:putative phosphoribosyl transferase